MIRELFRQLGLVEEKKRKKSHPRLIKHPTSTYSKEEWKQIKKAVGKPPRRIGQNRAI